MSDNELEHERFDGEKAEATGGPLARTQHLVDATEKGIKLSLETIADETQLRLLSHPKKRAYLAALAITGIIGHACRHAGISRRAVEYWRKEGDAEAELFCDVEARAKEHAADLLEEEVHRRAVHGTLEPVFGKGYGKDAGTELVGYKRVVSDTLLMFMLNGAKPEKYKRRTELTGKDGGPVQVEPIVNKLNAKLDSLVARRQEQGKLPEGQ